MSNRSNVHALREEFRVYTDPDNLYEDDQNPGVKRVKLSITSDPTNLSRDEGHFSPEEYDPTRRDKIREALVDYGLTPKRALAAGAVVGLLAAGAIGTNVLNQSGGGDTTLETNMFADVDREPLESKSTRVVIREGANIRYSPVLDEDKANGTNNVAMTNARTLEVTEGIYRGDWFGFQMPEYQPTENASPTDAAKNTYWINLAKLKKQTTVDGTPFASEYVLPGQQSVQEVPIALGDDGAFYDEQHNRVAVAHEIPAE